MNMRPIALVSVLLLFAVPAKAEPLNVVEVADFNGDQLEPTHIGSLDVGTNVVSGILDPAADGGIGAGDSVSVDLPSGLEITAISLTISNFPVGSGQTQGKVFVADPFSGIASQLIGADGIYPLNGDLPIGIPDTYGLSVQNADVGIGAFDWEWNVTVVPEPALSRSFALAAVLGLSALRRSSRSRAACSTWSPLSRRIGKDRRSAR
jgi:hypothetical protein